MNLPHTRQTIKRLLNETDDIQRQLKKVRTALWLLSKHLNTPNTKKKNKCQPSSKP